MNKELNFLLYNSIDKDVSVKTIIKDDTIWLTQKSMAELFECSTDNISLHINNIYNEKELLEKSTVEKISVVQKEGNRNITRSLLFYNLDMIIAVGYRVNSKKATDFRIWATKILKEFYATVQNKFHYAITNKTVAEIIYNYDG